MNLIWFQDLKLQLFLVDFSYYLMHASSVFLLTFAVLAIGTSRPCNVSGMSLSFPHHSTGNFFPLYFLFLCLTFHIPFSLPRDSHVIFIVRCLFKESYFCPKSSWPILTISVSSAKSLDALF